MGVQALGIQKDFLGNFSEELPTIVKECRLSAHQGRDPTLPHPLVLGYILGKLMAR